MFQDQDEFSSVGAARYSVANLSVKTCIFHNQRFVTKLEHRTPTEKIGGCALQFLKEISPYF